MAFKDTHTRPVEEPTESAAPMDRGTVYSHPAFGQISVHRVSGVRSLYGSDFLHGRFVRIAISASSVTRDLAHDWPHPGKTIIEVDLSEAQWAAFVSSMNVGAGTQCTIDFIRGEGQMPLLPPPESRAEQFGGEAKQKLAEGVGAVRRARAMIDELGLPKGKADKLREELDRSIRELSQNLPFVAKSFDEHTERTTERAKAEVHGYINAAIARAGIAALSSTEEPLLSLPGKEG
ncbi:hypothetical protein [Microcystis phage Mae-JY30]